MVSTLQLAPLACLSSAIRLDGLTRLTRPTSAQSKKSHGRLMELCVQVHAVAEMSFSDKLSTDNSITATGKPISMMRTGSS